MKRKLVGYEVFQEMKGDSLSNAINELVLAEEHIAEALDESGLEIVSYDTDTVMFEGDSGIFYRAGYVVTPNRIELDSVEQIVIDEDSEEAARKEMLGDIVEAILDDNKAKASVQFEEYLSLLSRDHQREISERVSNDGSYARLYGSKDRTKGKTTPKISFRTGKKDPKKVEAARKGHRAHTTSYKKGYDKRHRGLASERIRRKSYKSVHGKLRSLNAGKAYTGKRKKHMNEWLVLSENVFGYIDMNRGSKLFESFVNDDNSVKITVPTLRVRNEGKILKIQHDLIKTDLKYLRESTYKLTQNETFCRLIGDLRKHNNVSDSRGLRECIEKIVSTFPGVLYTSQEEMAKIVAEALEALNVVKFDDRMCSFMAEGILRLAHETYSERAQKLITVAEIVESDDKFADFQKAVKKFSPTLDEAIAAEAKMFSDLFDAVSDVRELAVEHRNDVVKSEASAFMSDLRDIINGKPADLTLAEDVAEWLNDFVETNLGGQDFEVVKSPHTTLNGDHPVLAQKAKKGYSPDADLEAEKLDNDTAFGIDGETMSHRKGDELKSHGWGNKAGKDVFPDLSNPYLPADAGEWTMKGEKGVDKEEEDSISQWQSGDTYPNLKNPYLPADANVFKQTVDTSNTVD